jgi:hypothetical protein
MLFYNLSGFTEVRLMLFYNLRDLQPAKSCCLKACGIYNRQNHVVLKPAGFTTGKIMLFYSLQDLQPAKLCCFIAFGDLQPAKSCCFKACGIYNRQNNACLRPVKFTRH